MPRKPPPPRRARPAPFPASAADARQVPSARAERLPPWLAQWLAPVALALLHLGLVLAALTPAPDVGGDNAAYVSLARSLLEGGYRETWDPAARPHAQYPPVFPALLAAALALGVEGWVALRTVMAAVSAAAVAASYLWLRRALAPGVALGAGLLLAVAPGVVLLSQPVLSDVPFWALAALALWAFEPRGEDRPGEGRLVLGAAAVALAYFTRSAGLPLALAVAGWLAWHRRWRPLGALALFVVPAAVAWGVRAARLGAPGYLAPFRLVDPYQPALGTIGPADLALRMAVNAARYLGAHLPAVLTGSAGGLAVALGAAVAVLALAGWARRLRRPGVAEIFFPLYAGLLLVWPVTWSGERFLLPLLPLLLGWAGEAARDAAGRVRRPALAAVAAGVLGAAMLPGLAAQVRTGTACREAQRAGEPFPCLRPEWRDLLASAAGMRGRLPEGSVVLSRKPMLFHALSGYPSRIYPLSASPDTFFAAAAAAGAQWVVVDQVPDLAPLYLHPVLLERSEDFCVVPELSLPDAALAHVDTAGPPRPADAPPNAFRNCPLGSVVPEPSPDGG